MWRRRRLKKYINTQAACILFCYDLSLVATLPNSDKVYSITKASFYQCHIVSEVFGKHHCSVMGLLIRAWLLWTKWRWVLLFYMCQTAVFFQLSNSGRMSQSSSLLAQCALRPSGYSWGQDGRKHTHSLRDTHTYRRIRQVFHTWTVPSFHTHTHSRTLTQVSGVWWHLTSTCHSLSLTNPNVISLTFHLLSKQERSGS